MKLFNSFFRFLCLLAATTAAVQPALAISEADSQTLSYLSLKPQQVVERDARLDKILKNLNSVNNAQLVQLIGSEYGLDVAFDQGSINENQITRNYPALDSTADMMKNAVGYALYGEGHLSEIPVKYRPVEQLFNIKRASGNVINSCLPTSSLPYKTLTKNSRFNDSNLKAMQRESMMLAIQTTAAGTASIETRIRGGVSTFDSVPAEMPVINEFVLGMQKTNLGAVGATLVFLSCDLRVQPVNVYYPKQSDLKTVPKPLIFVSASATKDEIAKAMTTFAPGIYAYNELVMANLLPTNEIIEEALQYPEVTALQQKIEKQVRHKISQDQMRSFLTHTLYAALGSVIVIGGVAAGSAMLKSMTFEPTNSGLLGLWKNEWDFLTWNW